MKTVVLEVPGLHLGFLGCYGAEYVATPAFDRLAAQGAVFDQHLADCPAAPVRSSWSGRYAFPSPEGREGLPVNSVQTLPAILEGQGIAVRTIEAERRARGRADLTARWSSVFQAALAALEQVQHHDRWLVWVELPSLAPPWRLPAAAEDEEEDALWLAPPTGPATDLDDEQVQRLQDTYGAVVEAFDTALGEWLDDLARHGWLEQTTLWLTGSTGLALAEHGQLGAGLGWPHEEAVHLPLLVRQPGGVDAGQRIGALTQPVDLFPTLLEGFRLSIPPDVHGQTLWPLLRGEIEQLRAYACAGLECAGNLQFLLRTPEWAFLLPLQVAPDGPARLPRLFIKPDDRWEVNSLAQMHQPWADHLEQTLRAYVEATRRPGPLQIPCLRDREAVLAEVSAPAPDSDHQGAPP